MKVMSEFRRVNTHLPGDAHLHGNIIYLQNGSLSPRNCSELNEFSIRIDLEGKPTQNR